MNGLNFNRYSSLCRMVQKLVNMVKQMDPKDPFRVEMTDMLLEKLYVLLAVHNHDGDVTDLNCI